MEFLPVYILTGQGFQPRQSAAVIRMNDHGKSGSDVGGEKPRSGSSVSSELPERPRSFQPRRTSTLQRPPGPSPPCPRKPRRRCRWLLPFREAPPTMTTRRRTILDRAVLRHNEYVVHCVSYTLSKFTPHTSIIVLYHLCQKPHYFRPCKKK